ncbi:MAG TPA: dienelactone hydrolase family protein [Thermohalobaculum sp.]|nr:dienelactone hydrolase family protein [Thermohalobaculum sp.]
MRLLVTVLALIALASPAAAAGKYEVQVGGQTRTFKIEAPQGPRPAPAVVVLHDEGLAAGRIQRIASFQLNRDGWAEIYPEALGGQWNDGQKRSNGKPYSKADDLGFMRAIVARLADDGIVDPRRVFFVGSSGGGAMVLRVVCEAPELAAGAAVVVAGQPEELECIDGPPVPLLFIQSESDPLVPFDGGPVRLPDGSERGRVLPAGESLARLALRNNCGYRDEFQITDHFDDGTRVRLRAWRGCAEPLLQFIVEGAGHTWPGNRNSARVEKTLGRTSRDISATFEIEAFFKQALRK